MIAIVESMNMVVHTIPMVDPGGVQEGRVKVLYQSIPWLVNQLPTAEIKKTIKGIKR
jgi:hypothetical protein